MLDKTNCDRFGKGKKFYVSETEIAGCSEMNKIRKLLEILYFAVSFGKNVRSRLFLFYLLLRPAFGKSKSNIEHVYQLYCQFNKKEVNLSLRPVDVIILREMFEWQDYKVMQKYEYKPKVIWDIGANVGLAGLYFYCLYPEAMIVGFEPSDKEYNLACKNYKNIPRHKIFNIALGKENTSANFLSDTKRAGGQCLEMHRPNADYFWERKQVSVRRAESLIEAQECDIPDMLKIDVEGGEYDVLTGFSEYLHYVREIMIEIHTTDLYEKCRSLVEQYGFRIYQEEKKGNTDVRFVCFVK